MDYAHVGGGKSASRQIAAYVCNIEPTSNTIQHGVPLNLLWCSHARDLPTITGWFWPPSLYLISREKRVGAALQMSTSDALVMKGTVENVAVGKLQNLDPSSPEAALQAERL